MDSKQIPKNRCGLVSITVRLPSDTAAAIEQLARQDDRKRGGMIRKILVEYVRQVQA